MIQNIFGALIFVLYGMTHIYCSNQSISPKNLNHKDDEGCDVLLESFALASANYTFCAIRFARPIRLCQLCVDKYKIVEDVYQNILTLKNEDGEECKAKLINLDRLQVVDGGIEYVEGLWNRASCNKCFKIDANGNPTKELNENTKEIIRLSDATKTCIENHRNDTGSSLQDPVVCSECKAQYLELNSVYDSLKDLGFCMDIVDLMNSTRAEWSTELGCCLDRKQPEWLFLVSSGVFMCLPFAFYLGAFMFVTRKEQTVLQPSRWQEHLNAGASSNNMMYPD